jgi:hypothetical protein
MFLTHAPELPTAVMFLTHAPELPTAVMFLTHAPELPTAVYFTVDYYARVFTTSLTKVLDSSVDTVNRLRAIRPQSPQHRQ